ncbi:29915_t:CDS:2, partial [Racocetra persica]
HQLWVSKKYRAHVHDNVSINETSYMCEVLTRLFDTSMNGLPIKCKAWGACKNKLELLYSETGPLKSSQDKQLGDYKKLARLSKDQSKKQDWDL